VAGLFVPEGERIMKGRGLKFYVSDDSSSTWTRITGVKSYSPGEESVATSEKTYLDQAENSYVDHSTGLIDPGEVSFSVEYKKTDAGQVILEANLGKSLDWKLEWNDGSGETYTGTLTKRGFSDPTDDDLIRNYSIKRAGAAPAAFAAP
jgi:hypothetical protein